MVMLSNFSYGVSFPIDFIWQISSLWRKVVLAICLSQPSPPNQLIVRGELRRSLEITHHLQAIPPWQLACSPMSLRFSFWAGRSHLLFFPPRTGLTVFKVHKKAWRVANLRNNTELACILLGFLRLWETCIIDISFHVLFGTIRQRPSGKRFKNWGLVVFVVFWTPLPTYQDHIKGYFKYYNRKLLKQMKMKVGHLEAFV